MLIYRRGLDSLEWGSGRVLAASSGRITFSRRTTRAVRDRSPSWRAERRIKVGDLVLVCDAGGR